MRHREMCDALCRILRAAVKDEHNVAGDVFVYFDASNPRRCLAPDAHVKLGSQRELHDSWKTWELGTPELAFEVLSPSDTPERWTFESEVTPCLTINAFLVVAPI